MSKHNKKPQLHKDKKQLLKDLRDNKAWVTKMDFVKSKLYPALIKATTSIDDALQNLSVMNNVLMEKFLGLMKEKTMKEIKLVDSLSDKDPNYGTMVEMIMLLDDLNVYDAKDYLEGMKNEINLFLNEENKGRKLSELKAVWLDELGNE